MDTLIVQEKDSFQPIEPPRKMTKTMVLVDLSSEAIDAVLVVARSIYQTCSRKDVEFFPYPEPPESKDSWKTLPKEKQLLVFAEYANSLPRITEAQHYTHFKEALERITKKADHIRYSKSDEFCWIVRVSSKSSTVPIVPGKDFIHLFDKPDLYSVCDLRICVRNGQLQDNSQDSRNRNELLNIRRLWRRVFRFQKSGFNSRQDFLNRIITERYPEKETVADPETLQKDNSEKSAVNDGDQYDSDGFSEASQSKYGYSTSTAKAIEEKDANDAISQEVPPIEHQIDDNYDEYLDTLNTPLSIYFYAEGTTFKDDSIVNSAREVENISVRFEAFACTNFEAKFFPVKIILDLKRIHGRFVLTVAEDESGEKGFFEPKSFVVNGTGEMNILCYLKRTELILSYDSLRMFVLVPWTIQRFGDSVSTKGKSYLSSDIVFGSILEDIEPFPEKISSSNDFDRKEDSKTTVSYIEYSDNTDLSAIYCKNKAMMYSFPKKNALVNKTIYEQIEIVVMGVLGRGKSSFIESVLKSICHNISAQFLTINASRKQTTRQLEVIPLSTFLSNCPIMLIDTPGLDDINSVEITEAGIGDGIWINDLLNGKLSDEMNLYINAKDENEWKKACDEINRKHTKNHRIKPDAMILIGSINDTTENLNYFERCKIAPTDTVFLVLTKEDEKTSLMDLEQKREDLTRIGYKRSNIFFVFNYCEKTTEINSEIDFKALYILSRIFKKVRERNASNETKRAEPSQCYFTRKHNIEPVSFYTSNESASNRSYISVPNPNSI